MLRITPLIALFASGLGLVAAQSESFTVTDFVETTEAIFPTGIAQGPSDLEGGLPLPCQLGCTGVTGPYYACFINTTQFDGSTIPSEVCNAFLCSQGNYTQLENCLQCVIANGDEKPLGYHTNSSMTAAPTQAQRGGLGPVFNPLGLIDEEQANGWLRNVTERCESVNMAVTGAGSITATPTTTGPYYTSFASGDTLSYPIWTGLTQYPAPVQTLRIPAAFASSQSGSSGASGASGASGSGSGSSSSSGSSSGSGTGGGSPTSSSPASSSSGSSGNGAITGKKGSAGLGLMGMVLAYAAL